MLRRKYSASGSYASTAPSETKARSVLDSHRGTLELQLLENIQLDPSPESRYRSVTADFESKKIGAQWSDLPSRPKSTRTWLRTLGDRSPGTPPTSVTRYDNHLFDSIQPRGSLSEAEAVDRTPIREDRQKLVSETDHPSPEANAGPSARRLTYSSSPSKKTDPHRNSTPEADFAVDVTSVPLRPMSRGTVLGRGLSNILIAAAEEKSIIGEDLHTSVSRTSSGASTPPMTSSSLESRPATASGRVQQQLARNQQRRWERLQGTAVFSSIDIRDGGAQPQDVATPSILVSPFSEASSVLNADHAALQRRTSEALGSQVVPWRSPSGSPRASLSRHDSLGGSRLGLSNNFSGLLAKQQAVEGSGIPSTLFSSAKTADGPPEPFTIDLADPRQFVNQVGPRNKPLQCRILRQRIGMLKAADQYTLQLQAGSHFLLAARKRKRSTCSNYLVSLEAEDLARDSRAFCGKVRANFLGTEFTCYDDGISPGKIAAASPGGSIAEARSECVAVMYAVNVMGVRGPRKMTALLPSPRQGDSAAYSGHEKLAEIRSSSTSANAAPPVFRSDDDSSSALIEGFKGHIRQRDMVVLRNKAPKWNEQLGAYCLNFSGRVTAASVKNFQLVDDEDPDRVVLQYGKVGKDMFTMDYMHPLTALQAFQICLTSFDSKLGCE